MASVTQTILRIPQARLAGHDGELILDSGGGRLPTEAEKELLEYGPAHADRRPTALPYRRQDFYGRETMEVEHRVAILENGRLRATFLLDLGGRLWSIVDLTTGRELLHQPDAIRFANLALRNAWFAGGVEWNLGVTGHWGLTCEPVCAGIVESAETGEDPVLRLWAHERLLGVTWRIDVSLPAGSDALYVHARLTNPTDQDVPVYWWSNIAVPQSASTRVLADAESAFHFGYADELRRVDVPLADGRDLALPARHPGSADYFFLSTAAHPWIASVEESGSGLGQASTAELRGRKLFTWGEGRGGETWQRWLSGPGAYAEIQAGLARTQLEHLRLPPGETWRFTESYRAIDIGEAATGDWDTAVTAAGAAAVDAAALAHHHERLTSLEAHPVTTLPHSEAAGTGTMPRRATENEAEGWGALEVAAGHRDHDPATPYDPASLTQEQRAWLAVAQGHEPPSIVQRSAVTGAAWRERLQAGPTGWLRDLLLGHVEHADGATAAARRLWQRSLAIRETADARRALAVTCEDPSEQAEGLLRAHQLEPGRRGIAIEALTALVADARHQQAMDLVHGLPPELRTLPRVRFQEARARVGLGDAAGAAVLLELPLVLPDLREGEASLDRLWDEFQRLTGSAEPLPAHYDFRMSAPGQESATGTAEEPRQTAPIDGHR
ncbi:DUF5107 domain-containing protein [Brachybacterium vulturis]|uniref:DUF5107 domain-containing protein n=1 Tax=Brachybacterium vulturis TaxID=2017484 RepID=UPI00373607E8